MIKVLERNDIVSAFKKFKLEDDITNEMVSELKDLVNNSYTDTSFTLVSSNGYKGTTYTKIDDNEWTEYEGNSFNNHKNEFTISNGEVVRSLINAIRKRYSIR